MCIVPHWIKNAKARLDPRSGASQRSIRASLPRMFDLVMVFLNLDRAMNVFKFIPLEGTYLHIWTSMFGFVLFPPLSSRLRSILLTLSVSLSPCLATATTTTSPVTFFSWSLAVSLTVLCPLRAAAYAELLRSQGFFAYSFFDDRSPFTEWISPFSRPSPFPFVSSSC